MPDAQTLPPTPPAASAAAKPAGWWWCPNCKVEVGAYHVTNAEMHEECRHPVEWKEPVVASDRALMELLALHVHRVEVHTRHVPATLAESSFWALAFRFLEADGTCALEVRALTPGSLAPLLTTPNGVTGLRVPAAAIFDLAETTEAARADGQHAARKAVR